MILFRKRGDKMKNVYESSIKVGREAAAYNGGAIFILRKDFKKLMDYTMCFLEMDINCSDVDISDRAKEIAPHVVSIWERVESEDIDPDHVMTIIKINGKEDIKKIDEYLSNSGSFTIGVSGQAFELIELAGKEIKKEKK